MRIVKKQDIETPFISPSGEVIFEMIGRDDSIGGTEKHSFVHVTLPIGKGTENHFHKISEETYYILSGSAEITIDGKKSTLTTGDACLIMPGEQHQVNNIDKNAALEFLTVSAPAWVPGDTYYPSL